PLPEIQAALLIPLDHLSWIQTAYLSAEIVAIPLTGWVSRSFSTRGAFVGCVLGFTAASALCAGADSFGWLVAARIVQGFFGGFRIPLVFSAVFLMFEDGPAGLGRSADAGADGAVPGERGRRGQALPVMRGAAGRSRGL